MWGDVGDRAGTSFASKGRLRPAARREPTQLKVRSEAMLAYMRWARRRLSGRGRGRAWRRRGAARPLLAALPGRGRRLASLRDGGEGRSCAADARRRRADSASGRAAALLVVGGGVAGGCEGGGGVRVWLEEGETAGEQGGEEGGGGEEEARRGAALAERDQRRLEAERGDQRRGDAPVPHRAARPAPGLPLRERESRQGEPRHKAAWQLISNRRRRRRRLRLLRRRRTSTRTSSQRRTRPRERQVRRRPRASCRRREACRLSRPKRSRRRGAP